MPSIQSLLRPHIANMPPYHPILPFEVLSEQLGIPVDRIIKLDANENPYGPLPQVRAALAELPYPHIYPDPESRLLRAALAEYHRVPAENLLVGAGADELIDLVMRVFLNPGDTILNCPPTFGMYPFDADVNAAQTISIPRKPDFSLDIAAIELATRNYFPKLLFVTSPNNPDGGLIPRGELDQLLALPIMVVLDEAYVEFAPPGTSRMQEVPERENLIVLRTFSKWAGLAGLRVGFGAFPGWLMPHLWKVKQPYNVSVAAAVAARVSLEYAGELQRIGACLVAERERMSGLLREIPDLEVFPSHANFVLCRMIGRDAAQVKAELARQGILIRYFDKPGLQDCVRISVGRPEDTDVLVEGLRRMGVGGNW
ncbi:MAG: histidinol-phosphate transaminase [Anaerolineales bacterium]